MANPSIQDDVGTLIAVLGKLGKKHKIDFTRLTLDSESLPNFLAACAACIVSQEDEEVWLNGAGAKTVKAYTTKIVRDRFKNYKKYWNTEVGVIPEVLWNQAIEKRASELCGQITCSVCKIHTLNFTKTSTQRILGSHWHYDHRKDKELVAKRVDKLLTDKEKISVSKYFDLLWGDNIQHVCLYCHDLTRGKVNVIDDDLVDGN